MILGVSLIFGPFVGWRHGRDRRAFVRFLAVWLAVWVAQTALLLAATDEVRNRASGELDLAYVPLSALVLASGIVLLTLAAIVRGRHLAQVVIRRAAADRCSDARTRRTSRLPVAHRSDWRTR